MKLVVHLPEGALGSGEDAADRALRMLTRVVAQHLGEEIHGGLGGDDGYGVPFSNDTFQLHPYCWCEGEGCPWCVGCTCPEDAYLYFVDGRQVKGREDQMDFYSREVYHRSYAEHQALPPKERYGCEIFADGNEVNRRRTTSKVPEKECAFCLGTGPRDHGEEPGRQAPNFWHKPSGVKVWWYEWIGRSMTLGAPPNAPSWEAILSDCFDSLPKKLEG